MNTNVVYICIDLISGNALPGKCLQRFTWTSLSDFASADLNSPIGWVKV